RLIDAGQELVAPGRRADLRDKLAAGTIGQGNILADYFGCDRIDAGGGNLIVRKRLAGERIGEGLRSREVALALGFGGRDGRGGYLVLANAQALIGGEEESLVAADAAAAGGAELIEAQLGNVAAEEAAGIEIVVAQELPGAPVKIVRAAADHGAKHAGA